jgi:DNA-binding CsgD family transcriptional regulator
MDARLKHLTRQELEILNLACDGKSSKEIADVLGMAYDAVQENAQTINRKLGIENLPEADRKREMHRLCAAVADLLTDDPERLPSGRDRSVARRDQGSPKSIAAVSDLLSGRDSPGVPRHQGPSEIIAVPPPPLPWWKSRMVGTIFITAAVTAVAVVVYLALRGVPTPTAVSPSPTPGPINMVGQVASDTPGTPLQLGQAVTSVIDRDTRPVDVYSVQLQAGQSVRFRIQCNQHCNLSLWNPNTIDVRSTAVGADVFTVTSNSNREGFKVYTAAVDGTYPVSIRAYRSGDRYIASVQPIQ